MATQNPLHGLYRLDCIDRCARLAASARTVRALRESLLAAISRNPEAPGRAAILERLREKHDA
ncbi:MAG: hypothetical protein LBF93_10595 [Zoogloeaceae bacterium]|jgi:hypothetical protein|nr:hypothetical protein [Zoogloeaceae bacterium]